MPNARRPGPRQPQVTTATARKASTFDLPSPADLADRSGLQLALALLLGKIAHNEIDPRRASLLLYGLQTAAMLLPKTAKTIHKCGRTFSGGPCSEPYTPTEAGPVEDIIDDPIHAPPLPKPNSAKTNPKGSSSAGPANCAREPKPTANPDALAN